MEELIENLKKQIIEALNLEDMTPDEIGVDEPLFGDAGLGLDSIDALELILILERDYGIKVAPGEGKEIFRSVQTIADYITAHRQ
ncbi:MAG: phosphopantetheine-binding protein [Bacteroidales bacterium]|nr:phosphopantetheine-binding protein [Bacteroides sp.]MCM1198156.1 phosphopantetheine-binding protein [Clostridium sp.]MCM1501538.1 phosphopantetheine-binding protein [Bacteroidales bacterium]